MARWLLVVLMFTLPAQFIWAAAAGYCAHEGNSASFHIGHHAHTHHGALSDTASASPDGQDALGVFGLDHSDCSYCHVVPAQLAEAGTALPAPAIEATYVSLPLVFYNGGVETDIDRPKWTSAC